MRRPDAQLRGRSQGQSAVEFALVLPVFLLLTITVIDVGRAVHYYNTLSNAAREGARFGIVLTDPSNGSWASIGNLHHYTSGGNIILYTSKTYNPPEVADLAGTDTIVGRVVAKSGIVDPSNMKVTIEAPVLEPREQLTVEVEAPFKPIVSYVVGDAEIALKATSAMAIQ